MRALLSLASICAAGALAVTIESPDSSKGDSLAEGWIGHSHNYYAGPEVFVSPEFNEQVYHFEENNNVFNQDSYEARVEAEARLMISLEALKHSIMLIKREMEKMQGNYSRMKEQQLLTQEEVMIITANIIQDRSHFIERRNQLLESCDYTQHELDDKNDALVLYCQQFAFAPQMVGPCE